MYEGYPKETIDKIKELGLYGKTLDEMMQMSVLACTDMLRHTKTKDHDTPDDLRIKIQELQENQINLMYKLREKKTRF